MCFSCVASAAHFLFLGGIFVTEQEFKRELELYKKMYHLIFNTVTDVIEKSDDDIIKKL